MTTKNASGNTSGSSGNTSGLSKIKSLDLRRSAALPPGGADSVARTAGSVKGSLGNWYVKKLSRFTESRERQTITDRACDIVGSDPHAASAADSLTVNIVGTGLMPQSQPSAKLLGWTDEQTDLFQTQAEAAFTLWANEADARNRLPFWALQVLTCYNLLIKGEFFRQPVMIDEPGRNFYLAVQSVDASRIFTPSDLRNAIDVRDGIALGKRGEPVGYWVSAPSPETGRLATSSKEISWIPAMTGHRPGMLHGLIVKDDDQYRGVSVLAPAMKFFRDLSDYLDFELVGAIVAASFPVFIETTAPEIAPGGFGNVSTSKIRVQEVAPGQIMYGNAGERPHVLNPNRPGDSFAPFVERLLRAVGASVGLPYEIIAKDFSKTNYSSARAALLEAWRVYSFYQKWLVFSFCQPLWEMVIEEAWLRGMIEIPKGSPDFYQARHLYTGAMWIPPRKGHVDPVKEMNANILGLENNILTLAQIIAEQGGDWETTLEQRARERRVQEKLMPEPVAEDVESGDGDDSSGKDGKAGKGGDTGKDREDDK